MVMVFVADGLCGWPQAEESGGDDGGGGGGVRDLRHKGDFKPIQSCRDQKPFALAPHLDHNAKCK